MAQELLEIRSGNEGYGYLIERDAGFISPDDPRNLKSITENSTGLGLEYIYKQYHKYFNDTVVINNDNQYFTVKLPTQSTKQFLQAS